jgi:hypothetical protein
MDIKVHVNQMASSLAKLSTAHGNTVKTLKAFINEASLGDELIKNFLEQVQEACEKKKVSKGSASVYKSQMKKILTLAKDHKQTVMAKAEQAGNLDQWYKACLAGEQPKRNSKHKVNTPKVAELPKLQDEVKEPSDSRDPIADFKASVQTMLEVGMTIDQIHAMVDDLAKKAA